MTAAWPVQRTFGTFIIALTIVVTSAAIAAAQMSPVLKTTVEVTGDFVLARDLFSNAGDLAEVRLFRAPEPGGSGTINADRLARIVQRQGLNWGNPDHIRQVQVSRAGLLITEDEISDLVSNTLRERFDLTSQSRTFAVNITSDQPPLYVAGDKDPAADLIQMRYSRRTGAFTATISAPAGDPAARHYVYTGRAIEVSAVPVLIHAVRRGAVITAHDVEVRNVAVRRIDSSTVLETVDLVGMAALRTLRAGQPIRARDLEQPQIVRRNATVTVEHKGPGLVLTVRATAMQSGALGDIINIRNRTSNRIIQGKIIGPERVEAVVRTSRQVAVAN